MDLRRPPPALSWLHGESLGASLEVGIALAVAAVPEGLVAVVTPLTPLALGMRRLADEGAIVRHPCAPWRRSARRP